MEVIADSLAYELSATENAKILAVDALLSE
jgi:hypothetical protein